MSAGVTGVSCAGATGLRRRGQCGACAVLARVQCLLRVRCGARAEESSELCNARGSHAICGGDLFSGHVHLALVVTAPMAAREATCVTQMAGSMIRYNDGRPLGTCGTEDEW